MKERLQALDLKALQPKWLMAGALSIAVYAMLPSSQPYRMHFPELVSSPAPELTSPAEFEIPETLSYVVASGDNLSGIFSLIGVSQQQMVQVLEADYSVLALDTLRPGHRLNFWLDEADNSLQKLELVLSPAHKVRFTLAAPGSFEVEDILLDGQWESKAFEGEVHGSFARVATQAGLSANDVANIENLFEDKVNFRRDLRAGDRFGVVRSSQFVDGQATGAHEVLAVSFVMRGREVSAFRHSDGQFYDQDGNSLQRAFLAKPFNGRYRISDHFNPRRKHPVTGRVKPHNGTDWALPSGTPLLAAGDGVVTRVENHPYAGRYVVIDHGGRYRTRYLHMSKIKVRKGQRVSRGQRIGLSGATGRVTGAHLHYEFHINGRPVNALKADIPMASSVPKKDRQAFYAKSHEYRTMMGIEG
ncbi:peptidoglycan DD-metalloendopeptidase family protein [Ferrimonas sp. YFM]|uniref:peptidoglycan DD-metalloendopeptidase family protein n=1 Tax=Ferrimonas sp. YFM TaxID=3028878 RepID=UPI00257366CA|nr:peptidoglycan DD-metalloendopeptidase family protein [Ferrimonas sp. YFM]BDY05476.1 peptidase M23 [Ferrimonas sp. YFM]